MASDQLDPATQTPTCRIHVFPLAARREKVRRVADLLGRKHDKAANAYWKQTMTVLCKELRDLGIDNDDIRTEMANFSEAVQAEIVRLTYCAKDFGGAA